MKFKETFLSRKTGKAEIIVLIAYIVGLCVIAAFHEPWFDESQAWGIARSASYQEILFKVPHYEGHPPLWHLILSVFAKTGAPYELSLKGVNIAFMTASISILLFRSPFPKGVRCILPFTYFFFYQFGILNRPYCVMFLAILLSAMAYRNRNIHPWRYILSVYLLCLTSAYGIIIACGLCLAWTAEILPEMARNGTLRYFYKDKRFYVLCFILIAAIALGLDILPADDCYYDGAEGQKTMLERLTALKRWGTLLSFPFEAWDGVYVNYTSFTESIPAFILDSFGGLMFWIILIMITKKNHQFLTFFLPNIMLACFMAFRYFSHYHIGIYGMLHVFIFWIMLESPEGLQMPDSFSRLSGLVQTPVIKKISSAFLVMMMTAPVIYSGISSFYEIGYQYGVNCFAKFIIENHLEDKKLMLDWYFKTEETGEEEDEETSEEESGNVHQLDESALTGVWFMPSPHPEIRTNYTYLVGNGATLSPYFDHNIFMNFNIDCPEDMYMHYKYKEDSESVLRQWEAKGLPDFIFDWCPIDEVYSDEELEGVEYVCIQEFKTVKIFKILYSESLNRVFIRKDLLDEYPQFHQLYN